MARHHNNTGYRQIKRGKCAVQVHHMARRIFKGRTLTVLDIYPEQDAFEYIPYHDQDAAQRTPRPFHEHKQHLSRVSR